MANVGIKVLNNSIEARLTQMVNSAQNLTGLLNRNIYQIYQNAQRERWMSENATEGTPWKPLNKKYREYKLTAFAKYPGAGRKTLIATGRLYKSVIGPSQDHRKIVEPRRLRVSTVVPYAFWVNEVRSFNKFGADTTEKIKNEISTYLNRGKK